MPYLPHRQVYLPQNFSPRSHWRAEKCASAFMSRLWGRMHTLIILRPLQARFQVRQHQQPQQHLPQVEASAQRYRCIHTSTNHVAKVTIHRPAKIRILILSNGTRQHKFASVCAYRKLHSYSETNARRTKVFVGTRGAPVRLSSRLPRPPSRGCNYEPACAKGTKNPNASWVHRRQCQLLLSVLCKHPAGVRFCCNLTQRLLLRHHSPASRRVRTTARDSCHLLQVRTKALTATKRH